MLLLLLQLAQVQRLGLQQADAADRRPWLNPAPGARHLSQSAADVTSWI